MKKYQIKLWGQLRECAGQETLEITCEGSTIADAVVCAGNSAGDRFRELILQDHETLRPTLLIFVGDEQRFPGDPLPDAGTGITLMTPIAGG